MGVFGRLLGGAALGCVASGCRSRSDKGKAPAVTGGVNSPSAIIPLRIVSCSSYRRLCVEATTAEMETDLTFTSRRSAVMGMRGMCASSQPLASAAGLQILQKGGTAADAAVAMAAALNVLEPCSTGIGGDAFALWYDASNQEVTSVQGNGRTPAGLTLDLVKARGHGKCLPVFDALTVTVPGTAATWVDMVERYGKLSLSTVLAPAIKLAEGGFPVAPITAHQWQNCVEQILGGGPQAASVFLIDGKRAPRAGEVFRNPLLAQTFRLVAAQGKEGFYKGEVAKAIVEAVQSRGGVMSLEDLASHSSAFEAPMSTTYKGLRVWETPPPSQGIAALIALNVFETLGAWDGAKMEQRESPAYQHALIESMRLGFADALGHVTDPSVHSCPTAELLSKEYAQKRAQGVNANRAALVETGLPGGLASDTVYFCVVDAQGNGCSMIQSNYMGFGIVPEGCGFSLQNRGHNFSLDANHPNCLAPRKRPYHTIIPGLATWLPTEQQTPTSGAAQRTGELHSVFGVMVGLCVCVCVCVACGDGEGALSGGFMQPQGQLQVMSNMIDFGLDPQAALDAPRFCVAGLPDLKNGHGPHSVRESSLFLEDRPNVEQLTKELTKKGHNIEVLKGHDRETFGRGQIIVRDPKSKALFGGSDPRADGCAMGW